MPLDENRTDTDPQHVPMTEGDITGHNIETTSEVASVFGINDERDSANASTKVYGPRDPSEPCVACGWTLAEDQCTSYKSSVKLFYAASSRGAWALGSKFILKERGTFPPSHEAANIRFLKERTSIPIPNMIQDWYEGDKYFTITSRIEGETLEHAWPNLSGEDRVRIAKQVAGGLEEMRQLKSDRIEAVNGELHYDTALFPKGGSGQPPLASDEELWAVLSEPLAHVEDGALQVLRENMPQCTPYTFTHGDLNYCNIIVKDGNFAGFIDFERSGFFPIWHEYVLCRYGLGKEDTEWKELLSEHITQYPKAMNFYLACLEHERNPKGTKAQKLLDDLVVGVAECPMIQVW
ncbi:kinase-like protein [Hypoxylon trugodes]|uniref:kinase-like protein n=1 Tax=Hypoxylon trugodes TaxID=326681 RepID=UPI002198608B|nr:kinase-like protein [Hypoxylon trugodes]KAI1391614.1 kinase-like protein [Hypoxylon trugodes]